MVVMSLEEEKLMAELSMPLAGIYCDIYMDTLCCVWRGSTQRLKCSVCVDYVWMDVCALIISATLVEV